MNRRQQNYTNIIFQKYLTNYYTVYILLDSRLYLKMYHNIHRIIRNYRFYCFFNPLCKFSIFMLFKFLERLCLKIHKYYIHFKIYEISNILKNIHNEIVNYDYYIFQNGFIVKIRIMRIKYCNTYALYIIH